MTKLGPLVLCEFVLRIKPPLSLCVVYWATWSLIGSFHEIASRLGNPVGERGGLVHLRSHRYPQGRCGEISSGDHVESGTGRDRTLRSVARSLARLARRSGFRAVRQVTSGLEELHQRLRDVFGLLDS